MSPCTISAAACAEQMRRDLRGLSSLIGHTPDELTFRESARACLRALLTHWSLPVASTVWVARNEFGPNLDEFERRGYAVRPLPDGDVFGHVDTDALENMLQFEQPAFIHLCHIGSMSGAVQPAVRIVEIAHAAGVPVVIDMSQSVGHVPTVTGANCISVLRDFPSLPESAHTPPATTSPRATRTVRFDNRRFISEAIYPSAIKPLPLNHRWLTPA